MRRIAYIPFLLMIVGLMACSKPVISFETGTASVERGDYKTAFAQFTKLAKEGDVRGEYTLGVMYINGKGVPKDGSKAEEWFRKAADRGFPEAQFNLGYMYDFGMGVPRDSSRALGWYRQAAEQGFAVARFNLALLYDDDREGGLPKNLARAYMWATLAVAQDDVYRESLMKLEKLITPEQIAEGRRLAKKWSKKREGN